MQKLTPDVVTQLNNLPGFPAIPNTTPPTSERWILGDWLVECHVNPEVANAAALPLVDNRVGDVRASLADQLWYIWDGAAWQSMAGGGGAVAAVTASAPIASSGGANPDISFPTWPANAAGSLSNDGAGNLSWAAAGGITGSGANGYLTLWNGTSTVTGINDANTNSGLLWKVNPNAINALGVRGYAFFGADNGHQIWLEVPGWNYTPPDGYVADVRIQRNNTAYKAGIQFAQFDGGPNALTYNWFFGQVPDAGLQRSTSGKIVLYAGANTTAKPDGTQPFVTFRQEQYGPPFDPGEAIVNENQQNHDFRVAGVTDANTLFVDGSTSNVGVGESVPVNKLTVAGSFGPELSTVSSSAATTIDVPSDTQSLPQATIFVVSTTGFPPAGTLSVVSSLGAQTVSYTGKTATSFTGCSGGAGTLTTGNAVTLLSTNLDVQYYTLLCDTSGGAITVNLPAANTCFRRVYVVKNISTNGVTVQANGAETIDGANTYPLAAQWDHVMIQSDGVSAWFVIG